MNSTLKNKILKNIIVGINKNTTIMSLCVKNKISYSTFKRWLSEDKVFAELYSEKTKEVEIEFNHELISVSKQKLLEKVNEGNLIAIKYALDNMYIPFNKNLPEIKKVLIENIINKISILELESDVFNQLLEVLKYIDNSPINE